jgi:hypothetical protein
MTMTVQHLFSSRSIVAVDFDKMLLTGKNTFLCDHFDKNAADQQKKNSLSQRNVFLPVSSILSFLKPSQNVFARLIQAIVVISVFSG